MRLRTGAMAVVAGAALILGLALPAAAHHSYSMFDRGKTLTLTGEVQGFDMIAPHGWLRLTAPDAQGRAVAYALEMGPPGILMRQGWTARTLAPGDKLTARMHPLRDGTSGGQLVSVKLSDGRTLIGGPERGGAKGFDSDER